VDLNVPTPAPTMRGVPQQDDAGRKLELVLQVRANLLFSPSLKRQLNKELDENLARLHAKIRKLEQEARKLEEWRKLLTSGPLTRRESSSGSVSRVTTPKDSFSLPYEHVSAGGADQGVATTPLRSVADLEKHDTVVLKSEEGGTSSALKATRAQPILHDAAVVKEEEQPVFPAEEAPSSVVAKQPVRREAVPADKMEHKQIAPSKRAQPVVRAAIAAPLR
jgi:hypothetical protein